MLYVTFSVFAICGSSALAGVMIAIGYILGPYWKSLPPAEFLTFFKDTSGYIQRVVPWVVMPCLLGLFGSNILGWTAAPGARPLWAMSLFCMLSVLVATMVWFVPENSRLISGAVNVLQVPQRLELWLLLHHGRVILALVGSVCAVLALTQHQQGNLP